MSFSLFSCCSFIHQRTAYLITSRKPSNCCRSLTSPQTTVLNQINYQIVLLCSNRDHWSKKEQKESKRSFYLPISVHRRSANSSSTHGFSFLRQSEPETLEISRAAEVFQTTLQVLKSKAKQRYKRDFTAQGRLTFFH